MLAIKVRKEGAEKVKQYLARWKLANNNYKIVRSEEFIYFPLNPGSDGIEVKNLSKMDAQLADHKFQKATRKVPEKSYVPGGYDIVGNIAIIESEAKGSKAIAKKIMALNKNVSTVVRKAGAVTGKYRVRKYAHVMGKKQYSTLYRENGAAFRFDLRKTFFSTRLAYERNRVSNACKDGENVIVMFAGAGPFAIEIAKTHRNSHVVGIELNKSAYSYMVGNIKLNNVKNVIPELGDVKKVAKKYAKFADRVIMPLPWDSYKFLDSVLIVAKKRCIVHYYAFGDKDKAFDFNIKRLRGFFAQRGKKLKVLDKRVVRTYSAKEIEVVIDFLIY